MVKGTLSRTGTRAVVPGVSRVYISASGGMTICKSDNNNTPSIGIIIGQTRAVVSRASRDLRPLERDDAVDSLAAPGKEGDVA